MRRAALVGAVVLGAALAHAGPAPIHLTYDAAHLDVDKHVMQFKPSRTIASATLEVTGEDGQPIAAADATWDHAPTDAGGWWTVTWTPLAKRDQERVLALKLRVVAADGTATNLKLIPWSFTVDHEDVNFASNSAELDASERAKLDASLVTIREVATRVAPYTAVTLYIAGHTDTVGASAANRTLSLARARAIGAYFRTQEPALAIAYAGFGEDVPKVKTQDNVDERANRRADYVITATGSPPPFKGAYIAAKAQWKAIAVAKPAK